MITIVFLLVINDCSISNGEALSISHKLITPYRLDSFCKELDRHSLRGVPMGKLDNEYD